MEASTRELPEAERRGAYLYVSSLYRVVKAAPSSPSRTQEKASALRAVRSEAKDLMEPVYDSE